MKVLLYTFLFHKYGAIYLDCVSNEEGVIAYGYNKSTEQYIFCNVIDGYKLRLRFITNSKSQALFHIKILSKGI